MWLLDTPEGSIQIQQVVHEVLLSIQSTEKNNYIFLYSYNLLFSHLYN